MIISCVNFRHELALGLIAGYSGRVRGGCANQIGIHHDADNVAFHKNTHMRSKRVRRCVGHSRFEPDGKKYKDTAYGCVQCQVRTAFWQKYLLFVQSILQLNYQVEFKEWKRQFSITGILVQKLSSPLSPLSTR